jgi:hypothetical protein
MEPPRLIDIHLERKEGATSLTLQQIRHAAAKQSSNSTIIMRSTATATATWRIEAFKNGLWLEIPRSSWSGVEKVAREEFGTSLDLAFLEERNGDTTLSAKYVLEATVDAKQLNAFTDRLDPLIHDVIERHAPLPALYAR